MGCNVIAAQDVGIPWAGMFDNEKLMKVVVQCYSSRKADERPLRFRLEETQYLVEEVLDRWHDPGGVLYKVRADDGNLYILRQQISTPEGAWELVSFRQGGESPRDAEAEVKQ
jgi:hypothetical protein